MLEEVKQSNTKNLTSVDAGITQIADAGEKARALGNLLSDSRKKTEQIAQSSSQTRQHSEKVLHMAEETADLVQNSLNCADSIVGEAKSQEQITSRTEKTFSSVKQFAEDLYQLSQFDRKEERR